jgi:asparagine synthase (glutamine-hydrolysing)
MDSGFAGWFGPRPVAAAAPRGERSAELGPLSVAWWGAAERPGSDRVLCLADGRTGDPASAYETRGEAGLDELDGEFALLLWDRTVNRGLLARDPLGHRSLYLYVRGHSVAFATELGPLLRLLGRTPGPDEVAVAHWLARTAAPGGRTLYEGVTRLGPGELMRLGPGRVERRRWWRPRFVEPERRDAASAAGELRAHMAAAVDRSLAASGRPGVLLSGGFDSGSVAALAVRAGGRAPHCWSAVFPDLPEVDESKAIRAVRSDLGLPGSESSERGSPLAAALEFLLAYDVPSVSPNGFIWGPVVRTAVAEGSDVLLDGEGGDEVFGCAPELVADELRSGCLLAAARVNRRLPGMGVEPSARLQARGMRLFGLRPALPGPLHRVLRRARGRKRAPAWLLPAVAGIHDNTDDPWAWKRLSGPRWWAAKSYALVEGSEGLGAHEQLRRSAALWGATFRHPFRDRRLIEHMLRVDPRLSFDPVHDRPLARTAMAGLLVDDVRLSERKPHFNAVLATALRGDDALIDELLRHPGARVRAYVRPEALDQATGPAALLGRWRALMLECWLLLLEDRPAVERMSERAKASERRLSFEAHG